MSKLFFLSAASGILSLIYTLRIIDAFALGSANKPTEVTASGSLDVADITDCRVVPAGGGFGDTTMAHRGTLEAFYGLIAPRNFEVAMVLKGLYIPTNQALPVEMMLRGRRLAYPQTAANTKS